MTASGAKLRTARALHESGRLAEAELAYREVLEREPGNAAALHLLGVLAYEHGKSALAIQLITRALQIQPGDADILKALADAYLLRGEPQQALDWYGHALEANPLHAVALANRAVALQQLGRSVDALDSYDRALAIRPAFPDALRNRAYTLQILGRYQEALASCDQAVQLQPAHAASLRQHGDVLCKLGRYPEALGSYHAALAADPGQADALASRGAVLGKLQRFDEALGDIDRALTLRDGNSQLWSNRGLVLHGLGRYEEALGSLDKALALDPRHAPAHTNRGIVLHELGRFDEELVCYGAALALHPDDALSHANEGIARLLLGDYQRGWPESEWRWQCESFPSERRGFKQPLWTGQESIAGRTILLHAEQGIGDTLQFARYAPDVARLGAKVILEVPAILQPLFEDMAGSMQVVCKGQPLPAFDVQTPLLSLPLAFGTRLDTIPADVPYLSPPDAAVSAWRKKLSRRGKRLIGLCWRGNPSYRRDRDRSIPLRALQSLFDCPGAVFVSLQKDLTDDEQAFAQGKENFIHPGTGFESTAQLVGALDVVISVDTAWAHWAGAIGRPLWLLLPFVPHWGWLLGREDSPWYPTARLFRQADRGNWADVIARVTDALRRS